MNMEKGIFNTAENNNQAFEMEFNEAKASLVSNSDEISTLILDKETGKSKFTDRANLIMARVANILPDANKLSRMDGRASPLTSEIGNSLVELFQYIQNQLAHADYGNTQMVLGAVLIQFLAMHIGTQKAEKFSKFIESLKSKLAFKSY